MFEKVPDFLLFNAERYPEKAAIVYRGQRLTFREVNERVNRLAHHLMDLGVGKGDRVGFMFYNSNQFAEMFYAALKIGALAVPLNFRLIPREVKWILDNARCKVFAYGEVCAPQVDPVKKDLATVEHLIFSGIAAPSEEHHFETFTGEGRIEEPDVQVAFEDPATIQFTGGTTGSPKGVVHTHRSTTFDYISTLISTKVTDASQTFLTQAPMFHAAGIDQLNAIMSVGGTYIILETLDPLEILKMIHKEKPTLMMLLPPISYIRVLDVPNLKEFDTSSLTALTSGAGAFPKPVMLRLFDAFPNASIYFGYGQTETGPKGTFMWVTRSMVEQDLERIKGIGIEHPFVKVKLVDDEDQEVPVGEVGEAIVQGPTVMKEYFEQPELTAQTKRNGWVHTGDLLKKDADGFYYFVDRKKDMIKTGGENVFAPEVEGVILTHTAVENCAVIGVPDLKFGEAVMAVVKLREGFSATEEEIVEHCKKTISSYKKPRKVVFVDEFPLGSGMKIQKFKLKEQYGKQE